MHTPPFHDPKGYGQSAQEPFEPHGCTRVEGAAAAVRKRRSRLVRGAGTAGSAACACVCIAITRIAASAHQNHRFRITRIITGICRFRLSRPKVRHQLPEVARQADPVMVDLLNAER
jgi:hypothetical protein